MKSLLVSYYIDNLSSAFQKTKIQKLNGVIDENLFIDLTAKKNLSYEQACSVFKEIYPGVRGLSSGLLEGFVPKGVYVQEC